MDVLIRGQAIEQKVTQAFQLWQRLQPREYRAFCSHVAQIRDQVATSSGRGTTETGALRWRGQRPRFVDRLLKMREEDTLRQYGVPCGTGDHYWYTKSQNLEVFHRVAKVTAVSHDDSRFSARALDD